MWRWIALSALVAGCMSDPEPRPDGLRILALGDSYTIGEGVASPERWPEQLADRLRQQAGGGGLGVAPPEIVAETGWTVAELADGIGRAGPQSPFDLVTLLVGVNDQYRGTSTRAYRAEIGPMLDWAVAFAGGRAGRVVAVSIPDWGVTPFGAADARGPARIADEVDAFNAVARAEADARGVAWVDVTDLSRQQGDRVVADGLHPDGQAYAAWTDRIEPAARAALATPRPPADVSGATPTPPAPPPTAPR